MRKAAVVTAILLAGLLSAAAGAQNTQDRMWAFHAGLVVPEDESFYVDDPFDGWLDRKLSFVLGATMFRMVSETFWYGPYAELETIDLSVESGTRLGGGFAFSSRYPARGTGFQVGGTVGLSYASIGDLDSQIGLDYSASLGVVWQYSPTMDIGVHAVGFYGWYGGGDVPQGVQNSNMRLRAQLQLRR